MKEITGPSLRSSIRLVIAQTFERMDEEEDLIYQTLRAAGQNTRFKDCKFYELVGEAERLIEEYNGNYHDDFVVQLEGLVEERKGLERKLSRYTTANSSNCS